jgi:HSP20 family molecular chaperone IbpA
MAEKTIETPETQRGIPATEGTRTRERDITPPVDIYETPEDLVVMADLPGVTKEDLDVRVENNLLTIRGRARHTVPGAAMYREYEAGHFFRQFELTGKIDTAKITAEFKHCVLLLHLPKAAEAKRRKIEIAVGA